MSYKVYKITHLPSGKHYIGQTSCKLNNRFSWHFSNAKKAKTVSVFVDALRKFPRKDFIIELIEEVNTREEVLLLEEKYIEQYNSIIDGFNMRPSDFIPWNKGKEMDEQYCKNLTGEKNPMYGKTHTIEYRKWRSNHMSEIQLGKNNHMAKKVYCVELEKTWDCVVDCAKELHIHKSGISHTCQGQHKTAGGYHFKYI
jgi:group I intron endonuclease